MKKVCYTVLIGDYDELMPPLIISPGWEYVCITDRDISSEFWKIQKVVVKSNDPKRTSRLYKLIPPHANLSVYIDANIQINCNLDDMIFKYMETDFMVMNHPQRKNIIEEGDACIFLRKDKALTIDKQIAEYRREGYMPSKLYACGVIARRHSREVLDFSSAWYDQVKKYSHRDQLSLPYVSWKYPNIEISTAPFTMLKFDFIKHSHKA